MSGGLFDPGAASNDIPDDVTLSARVPRDLRAAVLAAREQGERTSDAVRRLLTVAVSEPARHGAVLPVDAGGIALALDGAQVPRFDDNGLPLSLLLRVELLAEEVRETRAVARRALEREADARPARSADPDDRAGMGRPGRGNDRAVVLELLHARERAAGDVLVGMTADEVCEVLEARAAVAGGLPPQINGLARRFTDLDKAGAVQALTAGGDPVKRPTRRGRLARVYVTTHLGRQWLAELDEQDTEA